MVCLMAGLKAVETRVLRDTDSCQIALAVSLEASQIRFSIDLSSSQSLFCLKVAIVVKADAFRARAGQRSSWTFSLQYSFLTCLGAAWFRIQLRSQYMMSGVVTLQRPKILRFLLRYSCFKL